MIFLIEDLDNYTFEVPDYTFDTVLYFSDKVISARASFCTEGVAVIIGVKDCFKNKIEYVYSLVEGQFIPDKKLQNGWLERKGTLKPYKEIFEQSREENKRPESMMLN